MPQSKSRHAHKHAGSQPPPHRQSNPAKSNRVIIVAALFCAFLGLGIGFFIAPDNVNKLILSTVLGGFAGLIFGYLVKREFKE